MMLQLPKEKKRQRANATWAAAAEALSPRHGRQPSRTALPNRQGCRVWAPDGEAGAGSEEGS